MFRAPEGAQVDLTSGTNSDHEHHHNVTRQNAHQLCLLRVSGTGQGLRLCLAHSAAPEKKRTNEWLAYQMPFVSPFNVTTSLPRATCHLMVNTIVHYSKLLCTHLRKVLCSLLQLNIGPQGWLAHHRALRPIRAMGMPFILPRQSRC